MAGAPPAGPPGSRAGGAGTTPTAAHALPPLPRRGPAAGDGANPSTSPAARGEAGDASGQQPGGLGPLGPILEEGEERLLARLARSDSASSRRSGGPHASPSALLRGDSDASGSGSGSISSPLLPPAFPGSGAGASGDALPDAHGRPPSPAMGQLPLTAHRALASYITEPPASMTLLRQYAEEQLALQGLAEAGGSGSGSGGLYGSGGSGGGGSGPHTRSPSIQDLLMPDWQAPSADLQRTPSPGLAPLGDAAAAAGMPAQQLPVEASGRPRLDLRTFSTLHGEGAQPGARLGSAPASPSRRAQLESPGGGLVRRRLGVQLMADPLAEQRGVHNHRVAGDLFLSDAAKASREGYHVPPLPAAMARDVLDLDARTGNRLRGRSKKHLRRDEEQLGRDPLRGKSDSLSDAGDEEMDLELGEEEREAALWRRRRFWVRGFWALWTLGFLLTAVLLAVEDQGKSLEGWFLWWRLLIFVGLWPPIWWCGTFAGRATIWITESRFFANENFLFFVYTVRRPLAWVVRSLLLAASWAACMWDPRFNNADAPQSVDNFYTAYILIVKILGCLVLFFIAELLKVLLAKMIASKFNRDSHVRKMRAALKKARRGLWGWGWWGLERYLHALLQPRPRPKHWDLEAEDKQNAGEEGLGEGEGEAAGGVPPPRRWRPNLVRLSAPAPGLARAPSSASLRSRLVPSLLRRTRSQQRPKSAGNVPALETIQEERREGSVAVAIGTPPSTPHSAGKPPAGSPTRRSLESLSRGGAPRQISLGRPPSHGATPAQAGLDSAGNGGLLKQGSAAIAGLFKQGSVAAGLPKQGAAVDAPAGGAHPRPAKAPSRAKTIEMLGTETGSGALPRSQVALAAKLSRVEKHIRKKALQVTFYDELSMTQRQEKVTSAVEAKRLAFYLFYNVKTDFERSYLTIDDLEAFLPEKEAQGAFAMLDRGDSGKVSLAECAASVMEIFKEREYLAGSLRDTKLIVKKLGFMIGVALHVTFFFIYLLILGINAWKVFVGIVPLLGAASFAVGSSVKQAVDASVFLFVTHPYDVGDIIIFNDSWYRVEEITLPCTVLLRTADSAKIWYPNALLVNTPLQNLTVSPLLGEVSTLIVDADTPPSAAEDLKAAVLKYVAERPQDFSGTVSAWFDLCRDPTRPPNKLALKIKVGFNYNLLNARCLPARGLLFHFMLDHLRAKGITVTNPVQPVALQGMEALQGPSLLQRS